MKYKWFIKMNIAIIKDIVNEILDSEDERNDDENYYAILDRLEALSELIKKSE